jgi:hypothetical protein
MRGCLKILAHEKGFKEKIGIGLRIYAIFVPIFGPHHFRTLLLESQNFLVDLESAQHEDQYTKKTFHEKKTPLNHKP